jgi:hypothetical protein
LQITSGIRSNSRPTQKAADSVILNQSSQWFHLFGHSLASARNELGKFTAGRTLAKQPTKQLPLVQRSPTLETLADRSITHGVCTSFCALLALIQEKTHMTQVLEEFAAVCRGHLKDGPSDAALDKVVDDLKNILVNKDVIETYFPPENKTERKVIYEDSEMGFCILAHVNTGAKTSPPHDHGPAWAIYGQVEGETEMTEYACIKPPTDDMPGTVKPVKTYKMTPGSAVHYNVGKLHAPERVAATRLIRMESMNMDNVTRHAFVKVAE